MSKDKINETEELKEESKTQEIKQEEILEAEEVQEASEEKRTSNDGIPKVQLLNEEIGKLKLEVEDWKQSYLRKQADFQNFTKRKEKEAEELRKFASEKIIGKLLDGMDNLTRATEMSKQSEDFEGLTKGVELTLNQFREILKVEGLETIETEGKEFNPEEHMAVMIEENSEIENNYIIMELQKGYSLKGKVIRPSMVKVCKK